MKHILVTIIFLAMLVLTYSFTKWLLNTPYKGRYYEQGYAAGYSYIKSISELQEQAGMEPNDCDGIWGEKTDKAYDQARNNQYAVKMFERMSNE